MSATSTPSIMTSIMLHVAVVGDGGEASRPSRRSFAVRSEYDRQH